ncbi:hypothetical protein D3C71_1322030 [compost metagenome]
MAIFGQARLRDVELRCRVLIDRPQQFEAALRSRRITLLAVGAIAFQAIGRIDDQRLTVARQRLEFRRLQLLLVSTDFQHPLLLFGI